MSSKRIEKAREDFTVTMEVPALWTQDHLAAFLGKSVAWCERARWAGDGPQFVKLGRHVRYRATDVMDWVNSNLAQETEKQPVES